MAKYLYKKIDEVREDLIGSKVIDIEEMGKVIHVEDKEGRMYSIDFTGKDGTIVHAHNTDKEKLEILQMKFDVLMRKFNIEEEDLVEYME